MSAPYTTLRKNDTVVVTHRSSTGLSNITQVDVGQMFTVTGWDYDGRRHNKYISYVFLRSKDGIERRASIGQLSRCNPNFEPEGQFVSCVGCGATVSSDELKNVKSLNVSSCPSCGILEPTVS